MRRWQSALFIGALFLGAIIGLVAPASADGFGIAVTPLLIVLLYATFLGVPFGRLASAARDTRFLIALLTLNFVAAPVVAFVLSRFVSGSQALLVGVLLVLLTPCVDYVIAFTRLAGGASEHLLAATPLLMLAQLALLPLYLLLFVGRGWPPLSRSRRSSTPSCCSSCFRWRSRPSPSFSPTDSQRHVR